MPCEYRWRGSARLIIRLVYKSCFVMTISQNVFWICSLVFVGEKAS